MSALMIYATGIRGARHRTCGCGDATCEVKAIDGSNIAIEDLAHVEREIARLVAEVCRIARSRRSWQRAVT